MPVAADLWENGREPGEMGSASGFPTQHRSCPDFHGITEPVGPTMEDLISLLIIAGIVTGIAAWSIWELITPSYKIALYRIFEASPCESVEGCSVDYFNDLKDF